MGGILPHASSGGVYFIYDKEKQYASMLNRLNEIIEHFALMANSLVIEMLCGLSELLLGGRL